MERIHVLILCRDLAWGKGLAGFLVPKGFAVQCDDGTGACESLQEPAVGLWEWLSPTQAPYANLDVIMDRYPMCEWLAVLQEHSFGPSSRGAVYRTCDAIAKDTPPEYIAERILTAYLRRCYGESRLRILEKLHAKPGT